MYEYVFMDTYVKTWNFLLAKIEKYNEFSKFLKPDLKKTLPGVES